MPSPIPFDQAKMNFASAGNALDARADTETVLVVDDNRAFRRFVRMLLEKSGYSVLDAQTSAEAVQVVNDFRGPIHLLLTDVVMPQVDGYQLSDYLRFHRPDMCVLYMSGYAGFPKCRPDRCKASMQILAKPFRKEGLLSAVRQALDNGPALSAAQELSAATQSDARDKSRK